MKNLKYVFMVLLGGALYGTMSSLVKLSYGKGYSAAEISFWQAFAAAILLGACVMPSRSARNCRPGKHALLLSFITGGAIGMTNLTYYASVRYIPASMAIIALMQFTWLSLIIEWAAFKAKPSKAEMLTVAFILAGTFLASGIAETKAWTLSLKGTILALTSAITYAVYITANGRVGLNMRWQYKSAVIMAGSAASIFAACGTTVAAPKCASIDFATRVAMLAVAGTAVPTALFAVGIPKVGATFSSILMTVELPVAIVCARIILKEPISSMQAAGIAIMLAAIMTMNYYKTSKNNNKDHVLRK